MLSIISTSNEQIKQVKKLYDKKYRNEFNQYILEGVKIIGEAFIAGEEFVHIFVCTSKLDKVSINKDVVYKLMNNSIDKVVEVSENVLEYISDTENPQGIVAVVNMRKTLLENYKIQDRILLLDRVQDSGNMGTILRTAKALGITDIVIAKGSCDIYNPKVLRSAMGNIFKLNILQLECDTISYINNIKEKGYVVYSSGLENGKNIYKISWDKKICVIIGNEANGVSEDILSISDNIITIPMKNETESLNVSIATGIILSEISRSEMI